MRRVPWLHPDHCAFPDIDQALDEPPGLLAAGGDLTPDWLLLAYRQGIFPWFDEEQPILWWSPEPRCVIDPNSFVPSKSLAKKIKKQDFDIHIDRDFRSVIRYCSERPGESGGTWITPEMMEAYVALHDLGFAHSVESYIDDQLVGGLYGVALGNLFFGESMFHLVTDASKIAFAGLMSVMVKAGSNMVDCQITNPHLESLGATEISRAEFRKRLEAGLAVPDLQWKKLAGTVNLTL